MNNSYSRRDILGLGAKVALAASAAPLALLPTGCSTKYKCNGVRVVQSTDGQLRPTTAAFFNSGQEVKNYVSELADLLNETWVSEFGVPIDERICIQYLDYVPGEISGISFLAGDFYTSKRFSTSRMRYEKEKTVRILNKMEPFGNFYSIPHEVDHNRADGFEYLPMLTSNRIGAMAVVHNPQFGADTQYLTFGINHGGQLSFARDAFANNWKTKHHIGVFAALLALNQTNGDYAAADYELRKNSSVHVGNAHTFIDYCRVQPKVFSSPGSEIHIVSTTSGDLVLPAIDYHELAVYDLWFKVAHQVMKFNVDQNAALSPAEKTVMKQGMKLAARFPLASIPANSNQGPRIVDYQIFYKEGFTNPLSFIINPQDYDYSIPKGT